MPTLTDLHLAAAPAAWARLGFAAEPDGTIRVGRTTLRLSTAAGETGIRGWAFAEPLPASLDGLPTALAAAGPPPAEHPNGALRLDHVVVSTPDLERTQGALSDAGFACRRIREAGEHRQAFYRMGEVILELVGPAAPRGDGPAAFWGLVAVVADLDAARAAAPDVVGEPRDAVQPGRRIATVRREAALGTRVALMTD